MHRSIAQRLITEMLQRLAMHIVAGHAVQVGRPAYVQSSSQTQHMPGISQDSTSGSPCRHWHSHACKPPNLA